MSTVLVTEKNELLTRLLFNAGPCDICLLEGSDDVKIFRDLWFKDAQGTVYFHACGSKSQVQELARICLSDQTIKQVRGIVDRDFLTLNERTNAMQDLPTVHISYRHEIENYLITTTSVDRVRFITNQISVGEGVTKSQNLISHLHESLSFISAANALLTEKEKLQIDAGHDAADRSLIVRKLAERIQLSEYQAEQAIEEKLKFLKACPSWPHNAIEGKRLIHALCKHLSTRYSDAFTRQLASHTCDDVPQEFKDWLQLS